MRSHGAYRTLPTIAELTHMGYQPAGVTPATSDLKVTGEWAMVVRRLMDHTGVI